MALLQRVPPNLKTEQELYYMRYHCTIHTGERGYCTRQLNTRYSDPRRGSAYALFVSRSAPPLSVLCNLTLTSLDVEDEQKKQIMPQFQKKLQVLSVSTR